MRKIGLVIADPEEIHQLSKFEFIVSYIKNNFKVDYYKFNELDIYVCNSKIGIVNAATTTQHLIDEYKVNQIWNYGAVGSSEKLQLHEVVIPQKFYYFDVFTPWYNVGQIPKEKNFFINAINSDKQINLASGQSFIDDKNKVKKIQKYLDVDIFDMEACAIAQTCDKNNIPFYCIKAVSDIIGKSKINQININYSIVVASKKALDKLIELLEKETLKK